MNEVKSPKKPLVYYYAIVILVILALNFLAVPWLSSSSGRSRRSTTARS